MPKRHTQHPLEYRILVIGDTGVGKTSLIGRYVRNEFPYRNSSHINGDGSTIYPTIIDGYDCTLIFIDISTINDVQKLKFSDSLPTACLIVFSITNNQSFLNLTYFHDSIRSKLSHESISVPILFVANKIDQEQDRAVSQQSIDKLKLNGYDVFEVSVKGNVGIDNAVYTSIKHLQYEQNYRLEKVKPNNICACILA